MMTNAKLKWRRYDCGKLPEGKYLVGVPDDDGTITPLHVVSEYYVSEGTYIAGPLEVEKPDSEPIAVVGAGGPSSVYSNCGRTLVRAESGGKYDRKVLLSVFADAPRDAVVRIFNAAAEVFNSLKAEGADDG